MTLQGGSEGTQVFTGIVYKTEGSPDWEDSVSGTESVWNLPAGQSQTKTFEVPPPQTGEITYGLLTENYETLEQWKLLVEPPRAAFGETIAFYDGLEMTVSVRLMETIEGSVFNHADQETRGVFTLRPSKGRKWLRVHLTAMNTNNTRDVMPPPHKEIDVLAAGEQLDAIGAGTREIEIVGETTKEYDDLQLDEDKLYRPPWDLVPSGKHSGFKQYIVPADITQADLKVMAPHNHVRATWEG